MNPPADNPNKDLVQRRVKRDVEERNRTSEVVIQQEKKYVGPGFFQFTASSTAGSDLYVVNSKEAGNHSKLNHAVVEILQLVQERKAHHTPKPTAPTLHSILTASHAQHGEALPAEATLALAKGVGTPFRCN